MSNSPSIKRNTEKNALYTHCKKFIKELDITSRKDLRYLDDVDRINFINGICKILGYEPKEESDKE